jgi:hypothetical protein
MAKAIIADSTNRLDPIPLITASMYRAARGVLARRAPARIAV